LTSDAEPEGVRPQPTSSNPASLPPSSPEPDDDFDIDEVIRLDDERRAREKAAAAANSIQEGPSLSSEGNGARQDEGINEDDEAIWDELMVGQDIDGPAPQSQPPSEEDQDMWDVVNEIEMQMETDGAITETTTRAGPGPGPDAQVYGDDWDEMYAS
jgi:replication fork protection complex subunit Csm3/Swi3